MFYAHSTERLDLSDWEPLQDHLRNVARRAAVFGEGFGGARAAALAGYLHDLGKYSREFQAYIRGAKRGVDHSTAGARAVLDLAVAPADKVVARFIAYAIAGHHAGLPDGGGDPGALDERLDATRYPIPPVADIWKREVEADPTNLLKRGFKLFGGDPARPAFQHSVFGRMVFSCLVDADFLETEAFYQKNLGQEPDRSWPLLQDRIGELIAAFDVAMDGKQAGLPPDVRAHPLNRLRQDVLTHVRGQAALTPGVFTLDVPTGGGKTLASLAFALEHARRWGHRRIIYAIPFTSIIEQTADVFRAVLGEGLVLEHHSAIEPGGSAAERDAAPGEQSLAAKRRLAMENWDAPVVVTTNVQLLESLFAHRPSRCRKLHNIAGSVIVLDEAQVIPLHVLKPCVAMLDELALNYGCTIVLCTATQPALLAPRFAGGFALESTQELAPDPERLDAAFRRVTLEVRPEPLSDAALVAELAEWEQGLVIVNSRRHAFDLYTAAGSSGLDGVIHLSTRQTAEHRREILAEVRHRLTEGAACRVVATSLVEAGVDVSFPRVWRSMAGLDSIIQAAGRCNREWRWAKEESRVIVFKPDVAKPPAEIAAFAAAMERVSLQHADLFSKAAIAQYFREVYWQKGEGLDRIPLRDRDGQEAHGSVLAQFRMDGTLRADFAYRAVGEGFRLIEDGMAPVIVPHTEAARTVLTLLRNNILSAGAAARQLQRYVVQVPPKDRERLVRNGHVAFVEGFGDQFPELTTQSLYSRSMGLVWERADDLPEGGIV